MLEAEAHSYFYEAGGPGALSGVSCRLLPGERDVLGGRRQGGVAAAESALSANQAGVHREHAQPRRRQRLAGAADRGSGGGGPQGRSADASRWRAAVERERGRGRAGERVCPALRLGERVLLERAGGAGGVGAGRFERVHRAGPAIPQAVRRGHAQAGIIAAGALYALEHHRARLAEDHANAKMLAEGLAAIRGVELVGGMPETNIVACRIKAMAGDVAMGRLKEAGLLVTPHAPTRCGW